MVIRPQSRSSIATKLTKFFVVVSMLTVAITVVVVAFSVVNNLKPDTNKTLTTVQRATQLLPNFMLESANAGSAGQVLGLISAPTTTFSERIVYLAIPLAVLILGYAILRIARTFTPKDSLVALQALVHPDQAQSHPAGGGGTLKGPTASSAAAS